MPPVGFKRALDVSYEPNKRLKSSSSSSLSFSPSQTFPPEIKTDLKHSEKFRELCETCPPFKAFFQLTQLPKNQIGILDKELQEEDALLCLAHIYQFAQQFWILRKKAFNRISSSSEECWEEMQKKINYFNDELKPKIKDLIGKGATYLHDLTTHIFKQFSLIKNYNKEIYNPFYPSLIELTHEAFIHGNELAYKHFWQPSFKGILEAYAPPHLLEDEGFKAQMLIQCFMQEKALIKAPEIRINIPEKSDKNSVHKIGNLFRFEIDFIDNHKEDEKLTSAMHELFNTINLPFDVLQSLLALHYRRNRRKKFDQCLEQLLKKGELSPHILLMAAKVYTKLKQFEKANLFYEKYLIEQVFGQDKEPAYFKCVLLDALEVKIQLGDFKGADCHINKYIDNLLLDRQEKPIFISTDLIQRCLDVKKAINDKMGVAWFEGLDYLRNNPLDYQKADHLLDGMLVYQSFPYPIPPQFLCKAGDVKVKQKKWQEAEWFYDRWLDYTSIKKLDFDQTLNIAWIKYQVGNFSQAAKFYTSLLDHLPDELLKHNVYTHLVEIYIELQLFNKAAEVCRTVFKYYGYSFLLSSEDWRSRQLSVINNLDKYQQELALYRQKASKSMYNDFYKDFDS